MARLAVPMLVLLCGIACGSRGDVPDDRGASSAAAKPADSRSLPPVGGATGPRIVILGDSITAGLGLPLTQAFPSVLQRRVEDAGLPYTIVNAGHSGDTTAGGLSRLDWALDGDVRVLVVALGGNDALRALPVEQLTDNLSAIIEQAQARGVTVILAGMEAPPNFGPQYSLAFHRVYPAVAKKYGVPLVPFLLERVAGIDDLNQGDRIHPNAEGAQIIADNVWSALKPVVEDDARRNEQGKARGE